MANILHVEDDQQIRNLAKLVLTSKGHTVTSAADVDEALKLPGPFDLIVSDYDMGGKTGLDLVAALPDKNVPVILCTSHDENSLTTKDARFSGMYAGGNGQIKELIGKPIKPITLLSDVVDRVLARSKAQGNSPQSAGSGTPPSPKLPDPPDISGGQGPGTPTP